MKKEQEKVIATYEYRDEQGKLLYQVQRTNLKNFYYRRPNGKGGWVKNIQGVRRMLYRLPELIAADIHQPVIICEGEKDVDNVLERLGLVATTNPLGAATGQAKNKWRKEYNDFFRDRDVIITPDNDEPGVGHADNVAEALYGIAAKVRIVHLPDLKEHEDISDWIERGGTKEQLLELIDITAEWEPSDNTQPPPKDEKTVGGKAGRKSQATQLIELADNLPLFHTLEKEAFVQLNADGHREYHPLYGDEFKLYLMKVFYREYEKAPHSQAVQNALGVLAGKALFDNQTFPVYTRVTEHQDKVYVDLANEKWEAVEITPDGWKIIQNPPVRFIRTPSMSPLPHPVEGGSLEELRPFLNLASDNDWLLVIAWLLGALNPNGPYPVLTLYGEHGSSKSTMVRMLRSLFDPNEAVLRSAPRDERDLLISAQNSWCISMDNLSFVTDWLSDAICRLATGGGMATRKLFTNNKEQLFNSKRPQVMNGISELGTRPDLLDRSLIIYLPRIPKEKRMQEKELFARFDQASPRIIGALFGAVSEALRERNNVNLPFLPRMADFIVWVTAAEKSVGLQNGSFLAAYQQNIEEQNHLALESSIFASVLRDFMDRYGNWESTPTDLFKEIDRFVEFDNEKIKRQRTWPDNPIKLGSAIRRLAPNLAAVGIQIDFWRKSDTTRERMITLQKIDTSPVQDVQNGQIIPPLDTLDTNNMPLTQDGDKSNHD